MQEFYQHYAGVMPDAYSLRFATLKTIDLEGKVVMERNAVDSFASNWAQLFRVIREAFERKSSHCNCTYRDGCRVEDVRDTGSRVDVVFWDESGDEQTASADLVLGADGASSTVRQIMLPATKRTYAGYVIQRGLVPIEQLSEETRKTFDGTGVLCWTPNSQIVSYNVPGHGSIMEEAGVFCNWGWYSQKTDEELADLMTDASGTKHSFSLPIGGMQAKWVESIKQAAQRELPPSFAEAVQKTEKPFVQVITDSFANENAFCNGKVLLLGDAAAGQR